MPAKVNRYDLLISCPGDVKEEIEIIKDAIDQFNELYSDSLNIFIRPRHWKISSFPQSGGHPQKLLNDQFVSDCDAAVAIFWTRFGTPTDEYGSGTEEEIELMLSSEKQVFMYFSDVPAPPSIVNNEQYQAIQSFRQKYANKGIYSVYSNLNDFKKMFFAHLSQYFLSLQRIEQLSQNQKPVLNLVGIDGGNHISEAAFILPFKLNNRENKEYYVKKITRIFQDISNIVIPEKSEVYANDGYLRTLDFKGNPVLIGDTEKEVITRIAEKLDIQLKDGFFSLGNLRYSFLKTDFFGRKDVEGEESEEEKYRKIQDLLSTIDDLFQWLPVEQGFSGKKCTKLCLENSGTAIDEDVEITLSFPPDSVYEINDFPKFENKTEGYLLNNCDMSTLFGIEGTSEYHEYSYTEKSIVTKHVRASFALPGQTPDYEEDYYDELSEVFPYSVYKEKDKLVLKIEFQYIKHNTVIAFPTPILLKENIVEIPYVIRSKNMPEPVNGCIKVQEE